METILDMNLSDFENSLKNGTLPDFKRLPFPESNGNPVRDTNHPEGYLTEEQLEQNIPNKGYINRHLLLFMTIEEFKIAYYNEPNNEESELDDSPETPGFGVLR